MEFIAPCELGEALAVLDARGAGATVLAGGTDVVVQLHAGDLRPGALVHIRRLGDLRGIEAGGCTEIGALTTHWELARNSLVRAEHPALAEAALTVGGRQTQNIGTIAGNVVNASPAADLLPVLLVANARVGIVSSSGGRELPLEEFVVGRKRTALAPNELVTRIFLEPSGPRTGETYVKVGRRGAMEVALVGLGVRVRLDADGAVGEARIALGSVGPTAVRVPAAEAVLVGTKGEEAPVAEAGRLLQEAARPIDDVRGTAAYRRRVLPGLLAGAVERCIERARSRPPEKGGEGWS
jgi:carbon-monoxide dehydrogenase medium subunit